MAKKKTEPKEDKNVTIKDRILVARQFSREWHNRTKKWNKYWNGTANPASIKSVDYIFVNYVFAIIKNKNARLYYRNPYINVQARDAKNTTMVDTAEKAEAIVNKQMSDRKLGIRKQIKKTLNDWQRTGIGSFFTGWSTDLEEDGDQVTSINEDQPDFRRLHPLKVHLPPSFTPEKIPYVVIEVDAPLESLKANKNYNQDVIKNLSSASISYLKPEGKGSSETKDLARVKTFHYYDNKERAVFVQSEDEPILAPEPNPYIDDYGPDNAIPVRFIWGDDDLETEWPMNTIQMMEKLQLELNKTRTQKSTHRKRFNRKYLADKNALTNEDISKVEEGQDGVVVPVNVEGNRNINNLVVPINDANQTMANDEMDKLTKDDINVVTGSTQVGLSGRSVNATLGQDKIGETKSMSREDEEQEMVEEFVEEIYSCLLKLDQKRLQTPIAVTITGSPTQEWQELSSADIQGELSLKVISGSMVRETDEQIRREAAAISAQVATVPMLQKLLPEVTASILDTYPQFSAVAEKAKGIIKQNEANPPPPPPPPQATGAQVLVALADLAKVGLVPTTPQLDAAMQMAGLPSAIPPPQPSQPSQLPGQPGSQPPPLPPTTPSNTLPV